MMELTLADIMNRQVRHVLPDCTIGDAAKQMNDARMSSLLVMSDNTPLGIITERDLLRHLSAHTSRQTPVSEIMSHPVLTAAPDTGFTAAYSQVLNHHVRHLVVVDGKGGVIGLASETDFRNHLGADLLRKLDDLQAVMDHKLPQLRPEDKLSDAVAMMLQDRTSYALVVENGLPLGILTERDMAGLFVNGAPVEGVSLREVMHSPVLTVSHQTPVFEMAGLMQASRYRHLVVVDDAGLVLGMVTLHKLMARIAATVMNEETLRRQESLEHSMHHAESQLRLIVKTIPDLIWLKDVEGVYLSCNPMFERFFGAIEADIVGKTDYDFVSREQADFFRAHDRAAMLADKPSINEEWVTFADDGHRACLETTKSPMFNAVGQLIGVLGIAHDITERLAAAKKIERLTQLYNALSQCNQAIVHSSSEAELFAQICQDAVRFGGLKMAWVGVVDHDTGWIRPVASYGDGMDYLQGAQMSVDEASPLGRGPTGTAIRENRPVWCQDYQHDTATRPWHQIGASYGWGASAALPLRRNGVAIGAFTLYNSDINGFDDESRTLLTEMATDISFALDNFERETLRKRLELQIESERSVLESLARGESLPAVLKQLVLSFEAIYPGMYCSVLLLSADGKRLLHGAAASLPDAYCEAINGALIGEKVGSCGTAAFTCKTTVVSDIATDPLWQDYKALALAHNLAACWSVPILSTKGQVLGTFALYYSKSRSPMADELAALERGAHLASLAIERAQTGAWLNKLSQAVEQSPNSIVITDLNANIEYANDAFVKTTGYTLPEVMGKNPRILHSGKTTVETYAAMWTQLNSGQMWRGELINRRKDGTEYVELARISPLRHTDGRVTNYLSIKEDITEQKQVEARIRQLAHFDLLTGLPNQTLLKDRAGFAMQMAQRSAHHLAVLFLDIDHFKNINDTLGHRIGDELLVHLAKRMKLLLRDEDTLSRFGGDEFILVLPDTDADGAAHVAEKILETVAKTCYIEQHELVVTPSIGIAMYPSDGMDFDKLYQSADVAMYRAKQDGRNNFRFFTSEMQARSARRLLLENALRQALSRNQFELHYQPQISMQDGKIVGAEALLRWYHPELGSISPAEFIPVAEESGLILSIGEWVLRTAVQQVKRWQDAGHPPVTVAINLSAVQFRQARLSELVMQILHEANLAPHWIELELTESVAMDNPLVAIGVMNDLHGCGIRMSIDDFGTGYSSLSYLRKFKVNKLKIDQSFVRDLADDIESRAIVTAIITLASSMGFQTIAEGVETAGQLAFLRLQGCNEVQGYYFSRPLTVALFEAFVLGHAEIP
ncbi:diguanylate cyclase/phosphodiesterase with PAS/PAC and GAF sensor(s) [Gallionella capsiferriformans ES-2]|uniref:Diguanylate cyclase/phosphodiesterase with PAS/PAC and GAF sensor(S) n=2 Tax=Gallionella TaxID=96 RepID=D9SF62_GALCS|nr:diguanylate cyclase/phosphodiesterase with PAS/PAC and GAF sensor(s) [Gallionella capsiferriformans ES-2]